jgi:hypothetical protein
MITRAAIMLNGELWAGEDGDRHHNIIHAITQHGQRAHKGIQGFLNDRGQFLTREQAALEALQCEQVIIGRANIHHAFDGIRLYSEDLW